MSNLRIMITGGAGFIGSHLVDKLSALNFDIVVVDNLASGHQSNLGSSARFYNVDITDEHLSDIFEQEKPDIVFHLAAQISVQASMKDPYNDSRINVLGSINLFENCVRFGVKKVIYASSGGAIYGEPLYLPCDEAHPINPLSHYGVAKYAVEKYLQVYNNSFGLQYTVLRFSNVYGPRQDPHGEAGVVAIFSKGMINGEPLVINGSGSQERDFLFVSDLVDALTKSIDIADGEIINIGTGQGYSVNYVHDELKKHSGYMLDTSSGPEKPGEVFRIYLDSEKARDILGWVPKIPIEEGLRLTVDWFKNNLNGQLLH